MNGLAREVTEKIRFWFVFAGRLWHGAPLAVQHLKRSFL